MKGYIIESNKYKYLAQGFYWRDQDKLTDAWVHDKNIFHVLTDNDASKWEQYPTTAYPAMYDGEITVITGDPIILSNKRS